MLIRADIDKHDIRNVDRDISRRFGRKWATLAVILSLLAALFIAGGALAWRAMDPALAAPSLENAIIPAAGVVLSLVSLLVGLNTLKARKKLRIQKLNGKIKSGVSVGRFEYRLTNTHLIIAGAHAARKIAWCYFDRLINTKSSIVFYRDDGGYEFLPKNSLPQGIDFKTIKSNFYKRIHQALPYEEMLHAKPQSVTFERLPSDMREYRALAFKHVDGRLHFLRRFAQWTPLPAFLCLAFAIVSVLAFTSALVTSDLVLVATGLGFAVAAAWVFLTNPQLFRGPAHPARKAGEWPFAQSDLASVTLVKDAVFHKRRGVTEVIQWAAVADLIECPLTAYLVLSPDKAIALPKRAFNSAKHYQSFTSFAHARIGGAKRRRQQEKQLRLKRSIGKVARIAARPAPQKRLPAPKKPAAAAQNAPPSKPQAARHVRPALKATPRRKSRRSAAAQ